MRLTDMPGVIRALDRHYRGARSPIVELGMARSEKKPFQVLVATMLSARTLDQTTAASCRRLFKRVRNAADLRRIPRLELERLIYPVGFYRTKARALKRLPAELDRLFSGVIPPEVDELVKLPGVGRKTASLVSAVAFKKPAICVDTHVHRISNRWDLVRTKTPLETERALRRKLPEKYWRSFNRLLVSFGQSVCRPVRPRCGECPSDVRGVCPRRGVGRCGVSARGRRLRV